MNFLQKIGAFITGIFSHPSNPLQSTVDEAGKIVDSAEKLFDEFGALAGALPEPYKAFVAAFGLAVHNLDSYLDTIETQPATPPATTPTAQTASPQNLG